MVGSAIYRALISKGHDLSQLLIKDRQELDLTDQKAVRAFMQTERPDEVYLAAAKVGGILANNTYPAEFIYQNLMIETNVIHEAFKAGVKKLLFLGSSCIYPKMAPQPMCEEALLTGPLEPTNEPYAIAKIAGIKMCESYNRQYYDSHGVDYRCVMPTNLYGPGDNYHAENSHVIPGLIRRFHEAKVHKNSQVTVWGSGTPRREFLYADDLAAACIHIMSLEKLVYDAHMAQTKSHINVGSGEEVTIAELSRLIGRAVGYNGEIDYDLSKPDGTPRKLMDNRLIFKFGWSPSVPLEHGLELAYKDFLKKEYA